MQQHFAHFLSFTLILSLLACAGGPGSGPGGDGGMGVENGPQQGAVNPATRPSPGFTELAMMPATSTTLPPPASFLKGLVIVGGLIEINEVRMFLRDVSLEDGSPFFSPGPFVVRLIQGEIPVDESFPEFGTQFVPHGAYDQTDLGFQNLTEPQIPPELEGDPLVDRLVGHSIIVEGELDLDLFGPVLKALLTPVLGDFISFRFVSNQTVDLRVETPNAFSLDQDAQTLFLAFKVKTWLDAGLFDVLVDLLEGLNLAEILQLLVSNVLVFDTTGGHPTLQGIALTIEANINTSLRFALSNDAIFSEAEVDEISFSDVLP